jgi:hypothetical protein
LDEFQIQSASGGARLTYFDRSPPERSRPIEGFSVRVTDLNLSASGSVYVEGPHPGRLFADMARQWQGWPGELTWESLEGEFALRCRHDRLGHIRLSIRLRTNEVGWDLAWQVEAGVTVEAGQLDRLAIDAADFFGQAE